MEKISHVNVMTAMQIFLNMYIDLNTVFPHIVSAETILF